MKKLLYYVLAAILLCGCSQRDKSKDSATATDAIWQFDDQEIATWEQWFKDNHRRYVHLFGSDSISPSHNDAIDDLISLFYNGNDTLRHDYRMIQWRLDEFFPIDDDGEDEFVQYQNLEMQIDSLLNFNTELDYLVRRKSALTRLMYEFRIKMYEDRLAGSMSKEAQALFEEERKAWHEYYKATSDAYGINILRKESYYLKGVFWNNYAFDIMSHRLQSLLYMYFKEPSLLADSEEGDRGKVEHAYERLKGTIDCIDNPEYDYSYEEKMDALTKEKEAFSNYMEVHSRLLQKLDICDESQLLYLKEQTLNNYHRYDRLSSRNVLEYKVRVNILR